MSNYNVAKKNLVFNREEFLAIFSSFSYEEVESALGIEFPYEDGTYHSDGLNDPSINDTQRVVRTTFKTTENSVIPKRYPCVVVFFVGKDYHRMGKLELTFIDFVYQSDFKN